MTYTLKCHLKKRPQTPSGARWPQHGRQLHSGVLASLIAFRDHTGEVTNVLVRGNTAEDGSSLTLGTHSFSSWATRAAKTTVSTV